MGTDDGAGELIILRTTDGGETWQTTFRFRNLSPNRWLDMFFLDSTRGWLFIDSHCTFRTLDGGLSWEQVGGVPPSCVIPGDGTVVPTGLFKLFSRLPMAG